MRYTVEIRDIDVPDRLEVEIYLDREGLADLLQQLGHLNEPGDHVHLMTATWGGLPLTKQKAVPENTLVNHLRVTLAETVADAS